MLHLGRCSSPVLHLGLRGVARVLVVCTVVGGGVGGVRDDVLDAACLRHCGPVRTGLVDVGLVAVVLADPVHVVDVPGVVVR